MTFAPSPLNEVDDGIPVLSSRRRRGGTSPLIQFRLLGNGPSQSEKYQHTSDRFEGVRSGGGVTSPPCIGAWPGSHPGIRYLPPSVSMDIMGGTKRENREIKK